MDTGRYLNRFLAICAGLIVLALIAAALTSCTPSRSESPTDHLRDCLNVAVEVGAPGMVDECFNQYEIDKRAARE